MTRTVGPLSAQPKSSDRVVPSPTLPARRHKGGWSDDGDRLQIQPGRLGAMRNLGLDRPFGWFSSERVDLGREAVQLPARDVRGKRDGVQYGQRGSQGQQ